MNSFLVPVDGRLLKDIKMLLFYCVLACVMLCDVCDEFVLCSIQSDTNNSSFRPSVRPRSPRSIGRNLSNPKVKYILKLRDNGNENNRRQRRLLMR